MLEQAHRLAREKGVSRPLYFVVRAIVRPFVRVWYRLRIFGAEHVPESGAAIVAPNHKSLYDSFFIAMATKRHLRFMGKSELFEGPWARLLVRLGAFPVRPRAADPAAARGRADRDRDRLAADPGRDHRHRAAVLGAVPAAPAGAGVVRC